MKYFFTILLFLFSLTVLAQPGKSEKVLANAKLLGQTVFGTKDSITLDKLFAKTLIYGHSSGKIETREQAIYGISHNKSVYIKSSDHYNVLIEGDSARVKQVYKAKEMKADGTESALNLQIETVWIMEGNDWKLARRQATKIQTDEEALRTTLKEFHQALVTKNTGLINQQTDAAMSYGHSNGWVETKNEMIKNLEMGFIKYGSYKEDSLQVLISGDMAHARFMADITATLSGKEAVYHLKVMEVWVKKEKRWLLFARQALK